MASKWEAIWQKLGLLMLLVFVQYKRSKSLKFFCSIPLILFTPSTTKRHLFYFIALSTSDKIQKKNDADDVEHNQETRWECKKKIEEQDIHDDEFIILNRTLTMSSSIFFSFLFLMYSKILQAIQCIDKLCWHWMSKHT